MKKIIKPEKPKKCELCEELLIEETQSDNANRCNDCYEEWGDRYPDE